jgi:hypothetical protein
LIAFVSVAHADALVDGLATDDPRALGEAIAAVERAPATTPEIAATLLAAARACEDRLHDPARALALYERIARELPDAAVATAAERGALRLRALIGANGAGEARDFAQLVADADTLAPAEVMRRADALAAANWNGAPDAALWLGEHLRRTQRFADADARFLAIQARWPGTSHARDAARGAAGTAIEARDWDRADALVTALPATDPVDAAVRDDLRRVLERARFRARMYVAAWIAIALALALLLASLAEACVRGGARPPPLRPPLELLFLAPIAAVIVAASFTAHQAIAPAVLRISITGVVLAWLSGTTLDVLRARGRRVRMRAIVHVLACAIGVVAIGYIAMTRDGLVDLLSETVRFGPD